MSVLATVLLGSYRRMLCGPFTNQADPTVAADAAALEALGVSAVTLAELEEWGDDDTIKALVGAGHRKQRALEEACRNKMRGC